MSNRAIALFALAAAIAAVASLMALMHFAVSFNLIRVDVSDPDASVESGFSDAACEGETPRGEYALRPAVWCGHKPRGEKVWT